MNRRDFLQRVSGAIMGAALATRIPLAAIPDAVQRHGAVEFLRTRFNAEVRGKSVKNWPTRMTAGRELFEAYERDLIANERFVAFGGRFINPQEPKRHYAFKGVPLFMDGEGWRAECHYD